MNNAVLKTGYFDAERGTTHLWHEALNKVGKRMDLFLFISLKFSARLIPCEISERVFFACFHKKSAVKPKKTISDTKKTRWFLEDCTPKSK